MQQQDIALVQFSHGVQLFILRSMEFGDLSLVRYIWDVYHVLCFWFWVVLSSSVFVPKNLKPYKT